MPAFTLDDLVLSETARSQLEELVSHVELRSFVFDDWAFNRRFPRGDGLAALFSGPPGTGKTTAAEAVANRLSADVVRIDLAKVASKWVGDTAKNLAIAFREAERCGALLLFDEADALFGKRTEVHDAHDRYANFDVSYLLQRVETFSGLVILTTNKPGNIDEALLRRLRFVVRFEAPDATRRREIWKRSIPDGAAAGDIDWDSLAEHDLSGGHIQTAALSAAFMAAAKSKRGRRIDQPEIHRALKREYEKLDRAAPRMVGVS